MKKTDILVIGSGVAGLTFAIKMAEKHTDKTITVLTKTDPGESNTRYAQGGVAAVWDDDKDSYRKHIEDTLDAGDGLCKEEIVEIHTIDKAFNRLVEFINNPFLSAILFTNERDLTYKLNKKRAVSVNEQAPSFAHSSSAFMELKEGKKE